MPYQLRSDLAPGIMEEYTYFQDQVNRLCIDLTHSKVEGSNQNHTAEGNIGHLKKCFLRWFPGKFQSIFGITV